MKTFEAILQLPVIAAFFVGASVVTDPDSATHSATEGESLLPYIAIALLFAFIASAVFLLVREMRSEGKDQKKR